MPIVTQEALDRATRLVFQPLSLLLSFGLFQFVVVAFYRRRRQIRVVLLTASAFVGFTALIPLAHPSLELLRSLNSVSETCTTLTFLVQIVIVGRDSSKKTKDRLNRIRFIRQLTGIAEALTAIQLGVVALEAFQVFLGSETVGFLVSRQASLVAQAAVLAFITFFRFYYVSAVVGVRAVLSLKRAELVAYSLLVTHACPFVALENATRVSWEFTRGLYLRMLIVFCLWLTLNCSIRPRKSGKVQCKQPKKSCNAESCKSTYDRFQASQSRNPDKDNEENASNLGLRSAAILPFAAATSLCGEREHERHASHTTGSRLRKCNS